MEKIYQFKITAKMDKNNIGNAMYTFNARNERDARNLFKQSFPNAYKIISCVRGYEVTQNNTQSKKNSSQNESSNGGSSVVLATVAAVGGFVLSKLFSSKS